MVEDKNVSGGVPFRGRASPKGAIRFQRIGLRSYGPAFHLKQSLQRRQHREPGFLASAPRALKPAFVGAQITSVARLDHLGTA